jgi:hypothetical protein
MVPIFCINLTASAARRRRMERRFEWHGLTGNVRFVEAVGRSDVRNDVARIDRRDLTAVARLRSHLAALRCFLDETGGEVAGAIVMEDDVALQNGFAGRLRATMENVPDGTELVALGYIVGQWEGIGWAGRDAGLRNLAVLHPSLVRGTQAYWISRRYATEVLHRLDSPLEDLPAGVTSEAITQLSGGLIAYPPLVLEETHDTTLGNDEHLADHRTAQRGFAVAEYSGAERHARDSTIALCMIVRDEAAVIERCLGSVRHLIDAWMICDTGSTDATPQLIRTALEGIPGTLHHRPWQDFGHNRSELISMARGTADHLLLLDADDTLRELELLPPLDDSSIDAYMIRHLGGVEFHLPRLVRGDLPWRFEGRTHEYLTCDDREVTTSLLSAWAVEHHGDGSSRVDKFERDRQLLSATLAERPDDVRTVFYLAQTLETLGEREQAREYYIRRSALGGFEEEAWYAQWRAAALLRDDDPVRALGELLAASSRRPSRLEPVHDAIELCLEHGWTSVAHALSSANRAVERPDDILFVGTWLYEGGLEADHVRVRSALGLDENDREDRIDTVPVPVLENLIVTTRYALVDLEFEQPQSNSAPSIAAHEGEFAMIVRTSDRRLGVNQGSGATDDKDRGVAMIGCQFVRLNPDLSVIDVRPIIDPSGHIWQATNGGGLEDRRLVRWSGAWWMFAASNDVTEPTSATMVLARLDEAAEAVSISEVHVLGGPGRERDGSGWVPVVVGEDLRIIDGWDPLRVLRWDHESGSVVPMVEHQASTGGAPSVDSTHGVSTPDAAFCVIHGETDGPGGRRCLQRFVRVNHDGSTTASAPFTFTGAGIEFAAGLARSHTDVIIGFGIEDRVAALAVVPIKDVQNFLNGQLDGQ